MKPNERVSQKQKTSMSKIISLPVKQSHINRVNMNELIKRPKPTKTFSIFIKNS